MFSYKAPFDLLQGMQGQEWGILEGAEYHDVSVDGAVSNWGLLGENFARSWALSSEEDHQVADPKAVALHGALTWLWFEYLSFFDRQVLGLEKCWNHRESPNFGFRVSQCRDQKLTSNGARRCWFWEQSKRSSVYCVAFCGKDLTGWRLRRIWVGLQSDTGMGQIRTLMPCITKGRSKIQSFALNIECVEHFRGDQAGPTTLLALPRRMKVARPEVVLTLHSPEATSKLTKFACVDVSKRSVLTTVVVSWW